ncbi:hypothetical protein GGR56DRAFT_378160 [Xylariaceae sp. FL0804]|nr:hypothetical protein GGR56DRAFT_378160 [Xylariaceae sp. FL0804]
MLTLADSRSADSPITGERAHRLPYRRQRHGTRAPLSRATVSENMFSRGLSSSTAGDERILGPGICRIPRGARSAAALCPVRTPRKYARTRVCTGRARRLAVRHTRDAQRRARRQPVRLAHAPVSLFPFLPAARLIGRKGGEVAWFAARCCAAALAHYLSTSFCATAQKRTRRGVYKDRRLAHWQTHEGRTRLEGGQQPSPFLIITWYRSLVEVQASLLILSPFPSPVVVTSRLAIDVR